MTNGSPRRTGRLEVALAVASSAIGAAGLLFALFAPIGRSLTIEAGLAPQAVVLVAIAVAALCALPVAAYLHVARGRAAARRLVLACAIYLFGFALISLMTIGTYLMPGAGLAVVTAVVASANTRGASAA